MAEGWLHLSFMRLIFQLPPELRSEALGRLHSRGVFCLLGVSEGNWNEKEGWAWETLRQGCHRNHEKEQTFPPLSRRDAFDSWDLRKKESGVRRGAKRV